MRSAARINVASLHEEREAMSDGGYKGRRFEWDRGPSFSNPCNITQTRTNTAIRKPSTRYTPQLPTFIATTTRINLSDDDELLRTLQQDVHLRQTHRHPPQDLLGRHYRNRRVRDRRSIRRRAGREDEVETSCYGQGESAFLHPVLLRSTSILIRMGGLIGYRSRLWIAFGTTSSRGG